MTRVLSTGAALAALLGSAGLAQAQMYSDQVYGPAQRYESAGKPSAGQQAAPSVYTSPAVPSNTNPYWRTTTPGTAYPPPPTSGPTQ
jgi:hypothetical protein